MEILKYLTFAFAGVSAFIIFVFAARSKRIFRTLLFNAFAGICLLALIDLTAKFTGVYIPVNPYTVTGGAVFGIPALCGALLLKFIFI